MTFMNIEQLKQLAKRRGFFWQSDEIYGGLSGFYVYGHLGLLLKHKWENVWRKYFLSLDENFFEIETPDIMSEDVFKASGHVESFVDPICICSRCKNVERADQLLEDVLGENFEGKSPEELLKLIKKHNIKCPKCGGSLKEAGELNMMFPLTVGVGQLSKAYLRPETAQGAYVNFRQIFEIMRRKLPLGLAIIGKAFRNEISPRQLLLRTREFSQAELQIFFDPQTINQHKRWDEIKNYRLIISTAKSKKIVKMKSDDVVKKCNLPKMYVYYMARVQEFYLNILKIPENKFRFKELSEEEKAFYNKYHWDIELKFNSTGKFSEIAGIHYRTSHDLERHEKASGVKQTISIDKKKFIPHVIELSFGVDRNIFALLDFSFRETRNQIIMSFPPALSPIDVAVFPLVNRDRLPEKASEIYRHINKTFVSFYDSSGSIGRRYARQDEIGTPFCVTIDRQTLEDNTVTLRDRDTTVQIRIKVDDIEKTINDIIDGKIMFRKAGKVVYEPKD
ncbi:MAG: glycine--tRNA ligase [Candidatus Aenigmarchaeota archaeon]|nr:glycine--tRNA ligase [Candidatus Aenigmarchaeota archaeon]